MMIRISTATPAALLFAASLAIFSACQPQAQSDQSPETGSTASATAATSGSAIPASTSEAPAGPSCHTKEVMASQTTGSSCYDKSMTSVCQASCATKIAYQESDLVKQPGADKGDFTRCVVSGVVIKVEKENPKVDHSGHAYFMCCDGCARKFQQEPAKFIQS